MTDLPASLARVVNTLTELPWRYRGVVNSALLSDPAVLAATAALARLAKVEGERDAIAERFASLNPSVLPTGTRTEQAYFLDGFRAMQYRVSEILAAPPASPAAEREARPATGGETAERPACPTCGGPAEWLGHKWKCPACRAELPSAKMPPATPAAPSPAMRDYTPEEEIRARVENIGIVLKHLTLEQRGLSNAIDEAFVAPPPAANAAEPATDQRTRDFVSAIDCTLKYTHDQFRLSQQGYFSPGGWAYERLRELRELLLAPPAPADSAGRRGLAAKVREMILNLPGAAGAADWNNAMERAARLISPGERAPESRVADAKA